MTVDSDAVIVYQDEASLSNTATVSYGWSEKGVQPNIPQQQRGRQRRTIFGCVEPETGCVVTHTALKGNTLTFFQFLLLVTRKYPDRKVYIILDNVRYHHAKRLQPILERYKHRIELIFLPAYSPDMNCMERVWWFMRKKVTHNRFVKTMEERLECFNKFIADFNAPNQQGRTLCNGCLDNFWDLYS